MASDSDWVIPVTVTFRCTVIDPVAVARSRRTGAPWDVQYALGHDPRPRGLQRQYSEDDEDLRRLALALATLLEARPGHRKSPGCGSSSWT
ncbi:hypothetical protein OHA74_54270 [Streptomyces phaeochromogenes]|uniref:hypothetical protein n=1 Tax=Streptomyces phaeochromogenes TaxID=1923 RepID=UPI002E2D2267|nr:hypothetical protein [Streptomyces phaeochromogenes]